MQKWPIMTFHDQKWPLSLVFLCEIKMQSSEIVFHAENADYTHGEMLSQGFQDLANRWLNWSENKMADKMKPSKWYGWYFWFLPWCEHGFGCSFSSKVLWSCHDQTWDLYVTDLTMWKLCKNFRCVITHALTMKHGELISSTLFNHSKLFLFWKTQFSAGGTQTFGFKSVYPWRRPRWFPHRHLTHI